MKGQMRIYRILSAILLVCSLSPLFSAELPSQFTISTAVEKELTEHGLDCQRTVIAPEFAGKFPFNITVEIQSTEKENTARKTPYKTAIFAFTQEYFLSDPEFIFKAIEETKERNLPYDTIFLFSCDTEKNTLDVASNVPNATEYYAQQLYETDSICAFVVFDERYSSPVIESTAAGTISPMWIVKTVDNAFVDNQKPVSVSGNLLYTPLSYFFAENERLASFMGNEITSTGFPLGHSQTDLNILGSIQMQVSLLENTSENIHYNNMKIGSLSLWLNESLLTVIYIGFTIIVLISLCFSSFTNNAKNEAIFKDLSRTWFHLPLYILICTIFLFLNQKLFHVFSENPVFYFALKTGITMAMLFALVFIHSYYKFRLSLSSISFLTLIICGLNIFIFASIDLSLMFIFIIEYFIVFISQKTKGKIISLATLLLMTIPLVQPFSSIFFSTRTDRISGLIDTNFGGNFIFSLILVPFAFQWIRCSLLLNIKEIRRFRFIKIGFFLKGIIFSEFFCMGLIIFFLAGNYIFSRGILESNSATSIEVSESENSTITLKYNTTDNFDLLTHALTFVCPEGKKILRCNATLKSESNTPLYECNFNYTMKSYNEAMIEIPDGAEENIILLFSTEYGVPVKAEMDFYVLVDETHAIHEQKRLDISGLMNNGKEF